MRSGHELDSTVGVSAPASAVGDRREAEYEVPTCAEVRLCCGLRQSRL